MELGISTLPFFYKPTLEEAIDCCCDYGFKHIEIMCEPAQALPIEISQDRRKKLVQKAKENGLQYYVHAPIADVNLMSLNVGIRAEARRQLIECIRFTRDIGAKRMVFHIGGKPYMGLYNFEEGYKHCIEALEPVVSTAEEYGVTLLMENDPNKFGLGAITIEDCKRILDAYAGRLYFLLDVAHAFMVSDTAVREFTQAFQPILKGTHFSDNHRERDLHLGLGDGDMDLKEVLSALKDAHYENEFMLEVKNEADILPSIKRMKETWDIVLGGHNS